MTEGQPHKQKIAILGGGLGSMSAAFALTSQADWQERYEITVYQMGWRLGGKGASGRNAKYGQRIEEHGLHIWFGFYENAFQMMRQCYKALARPQGAPLATWRDAFKEQNLISLAEHLQEGGDSHWARWDLRFPARWDEDPNQPPELPGDGMPLLSPWAYAERLLRWMLNRVKHHPDLALQLALAALEWRLSNSAMLERLGVPVSDDKTHLHYAYDIAKSIEPQFHHQHLPRHDVIETLLKAFRAALDAIVKHDDEMRRLYIMLDLAVAAVRGILNPKDGVLEHGFTALEAYDLRDWLNDNGAHELSLNSALLRGIYDMSFAFEDGDPACPNWAASTAIQVLLRMGFTYKGAFMWKMQAGMGDVVFTPFYEVLRKRGVTFKFFHRVESLGLSADKSTIDTIHLTQQATVSKGASEYQPLVVVRDLLCWPSEPCYEQLEEGERLQHGPDGKPYNLESYWTPWQGKDVTLKKADGDFDLVLLGIPVAALKHICADLIDASPRWRAMVDGLKTVQTQSVQLWLRQNTPELGWKSDERAVMDAYVDPINSWADMTQVLDREDWPAELQPRSIQYFTGPMQEAAEYPPPPNQNFPQEQAARVKHMALNWFDNYTGALWPDATRSDNAKGLRWALLVDPENQQGPARFDSQFWRCNIDPSERYVLSVKGSAKYRLKAHEQDFGNLYLAGDWTDNGLNVGCVEATVISGMLASRAVCGYPETIIGIAPEEV